MEQESLYILREAAAVFKNPIVMYSIGKDSSLLLHLMKRAFNKVEMPLLHIDTGWKFKEMYAFRHNISQDFKMLIHKNTEDIRNPTDSDYTDVMKTQALKQALSLYKVDAAIGGARRDEEKSRAKERIFSWRNSEHKWDPRHQRPELFQNFNISLPEGSSMRVFPMSNWTELDVWEYIRSEKIDIVPLYFAKVRPVVYRNDTWIMVDDDRLKLGPDEEIQYKKVRFRTLGCYPLSGAIESEAETLDEIIEEIKNSNFSERQGRLIDQNSGMEKRKRDGYF